MRKLISIIMPVYNVKDYIRKAVLSVINQTYFNIELILVDDGDTYKSTEIVTDLIENDDRIKLIKRTNGGLSAARNTGLEFCKGEYVLFLDSDDFIEKDLVEKVLHTAEKNNSDIVVFGYNTINCSTNKMIACSEFKITNAKGCLSAQYIPTSFLSDIGFAWNKLYKTEYLKENNLKFEEGTSLIEDIIFNKNAFEKTNNIDFISGCYYNYCVRERKTLSSMLYDNLFDLQKRGFTYRRCLIERLFCHAKNMDEILAENYVNIIRYCCTMLHKYGMKKSYKNKIKFIKTMLSDPLTVEMKKLYKPKNFKDKLINICIKYNQSVGLYLLYVV